MEKEINEKNHELEDESSFTPTHNRKSHHSDAVKRNLTTRLNRIEGQIHGIKGLIEKDTYCDDVITQIAATQSWIVNTKLDNFIKV